MRKLSNVILLLTVVLGRQAVKSLPQENYVRATHSGSASHVEATTPKLIWEPFPSPTTEDLSQVLMISSARGWITAERAGKLFEFDGRAWRDVTPPGEKV